MTLRILASPELADGFRGVIQPITIREQGDQFDRAKIFHRIRSGIARSVRWTPMFRPLGAEIKMDFRRLLALVFVCVVSVCASKNFREERTSGAGHCSSSLPVFCRFVFLPPQAV
jgi:hypothetical protein